MTSPEVVPAPAKLTLSLRVTGTRPDGYHTIEAEMVSLGLADVLFIEDAPRTTVTVDGPFAPGVPVDATNLVHRACALAGRPARVHVTKNIPHGGGLGGGSTDAAAVLRWAGFTDSVAAAGIGADVAFCLAGGTAAVGGIGEIVVPLPHRDLTVTLFIPPLRVPTPAVYARWDALGGPRHESGNDLTDAAISVEPGLAEWRDRIALATGETPVLAGSGATWFLMGDRSAATGMLEGATVVVTGTTTAAGGTAGG